MRAPGLDFSISEPCLEPVSKPIQPLSQSMISGSGTSGPRFICFHILSGTSPLTYNSQMARSINFQQNHMFSYRKSYIFHIKNPRSSVSPSHLELYFWVFEIVFGVSELICGYWNLYFGCLKLYIGYLNLYFLVFEMNF